MDNPYMTLFPGLAITQAVLGFNLFGDALRDILDPKVEMDPLLKIEDLKTYFYSSRDVAAEQLTGLNKFKSGGYWASWVNRAQEKRHRLEHSPAGAFSRKNEFPEKSTLWDRI